MSFAFKLFKPIVTEPVKFPRNYKAQLNRYLELDVKSRWERSAAYVQGIVALKELIKALPKEINTVEGAEDLLKKLKAIDKLDSDGDINLSEKAESIIDSFKLDTEWRIGRIKAFMPKATSVEPKPMIAEQGSSNFRPTMMT